MVVVSWRETRADFSHSVKPDRSSLGCAMVAGMVQEWMEVTLEFCITVHGKGLQGNFTRLVIQDLNQWRRSQGSTPTQSTFRILDL